MPELPEVEIVKRGLEKEIIGKKIINTTLRRKNLRLPFPENFTSILKNQKIKKIERRSKYIKIFLENHYVWLVHLGMSGAIFLHDKKPKEFAKHDHVIVDFSDGSTLVYNDYRRFGIMDTILREKLNSHKLLKNLGVEPLTDDFDANFLKNLLKTKDTSIKNILMNGNLIVGIGNIYACESLFLSNIHPQTSGKEVKQSAIKILVDNIKQTLSNSINKGGSSLKDYVNVNGESGKFQNEFFVYGRENDNCKICQTKIKRIKQQGRSTFFCPKCQRK